MSAKLIYTERKILDFLVERRGSFVHPSEIAIPGIFMPEIHKIGYLHVLISGIRKKIGKFKIESRYGEGYKYIGDFTG